jgi:hypothetical protein
MAAQSAVEIDVPIELDGFVADVNLNYQFGEKVNKARCLSEMRGYVKFSGERVHLEGSFELSDLLAVIFFLDEGQ